MEVQMLLCQPAANLSPEKRRVIWHLLTRFRPVDVWRMYRHNKHHFYDQYATWTESKKRWAIHLILDQLKRQAAD